MKFKKKIKSLNENLEDSNSKLVLEVKRNKELEIYKLNSKTTIVCVEANKKKL